MEDFGKTLEEHSERPPRIHVGSEGSYFDSHVNVFSSNLCGCFVCFCAASFVYGFANFFMFWAVFVFLGRSWGTLGRSWAGPGRSWMLLGRF